MLKIKYLGHAGFEIMGNNFDILIDPYLSAIKTVDARLLNPTHLFLTHEHFDHCDVNTINILLKNNPNLKIFGPPPVEMKINRKIIKMQVDNYLELDHFSVRATPALHPQSQYPIGYLFDFNGIRVWHAGDTYYLEELERLSTDVALVPIGGKYTLNMEEAAKLISKIKPKLTIPMHYNTFEGIEADPEEFAKMTENVLIMQPGEVIDIETLAD